MNVKQNLIPKAQFTREESWNCVEHKFQFLPGNPTIILMTMKLVEMESTRTFFSVVILQGGFEILKSWHSNESKWAVLSCNALYYAVQGGSKAK